MCLSINEFGKKKAALELGGELACKSAEKKSTSMTWGFFIWWHNSGTYRTFCGFKNHNSTHKSANTHQVWTQSCYWLFKIVHWVHTVHLCALWNVSFHTDVFFSWLIEICKELFTLCLAMSIGAICHHSPQRNV